MRFGDILALVQSCSNKGSKDAFFRLSLNWNFEVDLDSHLKGKPRHGFLWELEPFSPSFKVGQTKV